MAKSKAAQVTKTLSFGSCQQLVYLKIADESDFDYLPGKYIIVDTKIPVPTTGKTVKRAYTVIKYDSGTISIAAQAIPEGMGSAFINKLSVGDEVSFSGPWGKFLFNAEQEKDAIFVASDTGINSIMGLLQHPKAIEKVKTVIWMRSSDEFLSENFVREQIPSPIDLICSHLPAVENTEDRKVEARSLFKQHQGIFNHDDMYYFCGDGLVISELVEQLQKQNIGQDQIIAEYYFRKPTT